MTDIFRDIIPSILTTKNYLLNDAESVKAYVPFLINRKLSFYSDALYYANQMNMLPGLDKIPQYQFYLNIIQSKKRPFVPWHKAIKSENLDAVKEFFGYSDTKAAEALKILSEDQVAMIREQLRIE